MEFIKKYTSHEEYEVDKTPNVSLCVENNEKHLHYTKKKFDDEYLTFETLESGTFTLTIYSGVTTGDVVSVSYSLDNGETWTTTNNIQGQKVTITTPTVNAGDEVLWKGNAVRMANGINLSTSSQNTVSTFSSTAKFNARGNIMSLLYGDEFKDKNSLSGKNYCFCGLFNNNTKLINGKNIFLPAITLANYCYCRLFNGCRNLTTAPELPATTLAISCYHAMFVDCTNITVAPELPATTLTNSCYAYMFSGCRNLTTAPGLPATTLASSCYYYMLYNCTSLTTAPELPATTLASQCYSYMFNSCTSLTTAPELPATTLAQYCYSYMFNNCISLTTAPELPATTLASQCYYYMFGGCTALTTAPELPATTLAQYCYQYMFNGCRNLTTAPELPATTLANNCYYYMFGNCTSLTTAPELPATTLANNCYYDMFYNCISLTVAHKLPAIALTFSCYSHMFYGCRSLITAPELPATTLANNCCDSMFESCTSLVNAPVLPATTLADNCYQYMFNNCTSMAIAPVLPATTLTDYCYYHMFAGCTNLNSITCLATDISASDCTVGWTYDVSNNGSFIKDPYIDDWTIGVHGIPKGWSINGEFPPTPLMKILIDDFPQYAIDEYDEAHEELVDNLINNSENSGANLYTYTNDTIQINGVTYYIWEYNITDEEMFSYLLTTTNNYSTLVSQSLENNINNKFTSYYGRFSSDLDEIYQETSVLGEMKLIKVTNSNGNLQIWVDDLCDSLWEYCLFNNSATPYIYYGNTIEYDGNTYYLWVMDGDYEQYSSDVIYLMTNTVDYQTLYGQSLMAYEGNRFTSCIGQLGADKEIYIPQEEKDDGTDAISLLKVEEL